MSRYPFASSLSLLVLLIPLLVLASSESSTAPNQSINDDSLAPSILQHFQAIANECRQYRDRKVAQLKDMQDLDLIRELVQPHRLRSIKIPEICLIIQSIIPGKDKVPIRLDMSNWFHGLDSGKKRTPTNELHNVMKRDTSRSTGSTNHSSQNDPLLSGYFFDTSAVESDYPQTEMNKNHHLENQIDRLTSDGRFSKAIEHNKNKLSEILSPVVLIPGLLGSRLQDKLNKSEQANMFCRQQTDWQDGFWLSVENFLPFAIDCWIDNARLEFDPVTGFTKSPPGVQVRTAMFGTVESVESLDSELSELTGYMSDLISHYEKLGYVRNKNLLAAPYDFRLAPEQLGDYFSMLKVLIEKAQARAGLGKPVTLVCHSMGCNHLLIFLRHQQPSWRARRVRKVIAFGAPWGGAFMALKALIVGDAGDLPLIGDAKLRDLVRTFPSISYLLPQPAVFAVPNERQTNPGKGMVLVKMPSRNYWAGEIDELMKDLNLTMQLDWFKRSSSLVKPLEPLPDVNVECIHGLNIPTMESLIFRRDEDFPDGSYEIVNGDGDGTVNIESLMVCQDWAAKYPDKIRHRIVLNTDHSGILNHPKTKRFLTEDVLIHN